MECECESVCLSESCVREGSRFHIPQDSRTAQPFTCPSGAMRDVRVMEAVAPDPPSAVSSQEGSLMSVCCSTIPTPTPHRAPLWAGSRSASPLMCPVQTLPQGLRPGQAPRCRPSVNVAELSPAAGSPHLAARAHPVPGAWPHKQCATWRLVGAMGSLFQREPVRNLGFRAVFPFQGLETLGTQSHFCL